MARITAAEMELRVNRIVRLLCNGGSRSDILQFSANQWGVCQRTTDEYIKRAREVLKDDWSVDRQAYTAQIMGQLSAIHKEAMRTGNLSVALGCISKAATIAQIGI
jgi:hypothetical protein